MFKVPRKLAFLTVPAVLALGAVTYGSVVAAAAPTPNLPSAAAPLEASTAESSTAPDAAEPNEPALPGGGHSDPDNVQANTQQEGVN
jgi:hypothetical protein